MNVFFLNKQTTKKLIGGHMAALFAQAIITRFYTAALKLTSTNLTKSFQSILKRKELQSWHFTLVHNVFIFFHVNKKNYNFRHS
jgi:hypothetical protein